MTTRPPHRRSLHRLKRQVRPIALGLGLAGVMGAGLLAFDDPLLPIPVPGENGTFLDPAGGANWVKTRNWEATTAMGSYASLATTLTRTDPFCIGVRQNPYTISFYGGKADGGFEMQNDGWAVLPYRVAFSAGFDHFQEMGPGRPRNFASTNKHCNAHESDNVAVRIEVTPADFNQADTGTYTDRLTVMISVP
jgi:hypothetical protein